MKAKVTLAMLCALTLGGCTLAVYDGPHRRDHVPHYYKRWHDQEWHHHGWRERYDRRDRYDRRW
jgi:hypothetical protein